MDLQRGETFIVDAFDIRTEVAQSIQQIAYRPLVHARRTRKLVVSPGQCQRRRQRTERGSGIPQI